MTYHHLGQDNESRQSPAAEYLHVVQGLSDLQDRLGGGSQEVSAALRLIGKQRRMIDGIRSAVQEFER